jgi:hypothetical protein
MAKKKAATSKEDSVTPSTTTKAPPTPATTSVVFPELSPKEGLECRTILEDQILVVDVCLTPLCHTTTEEILPYSNIRITRNSSLLRNAKPMPNSLITSHWS